MPVDREEFLRNAKKRILQESTAAERLEGLTSEQILAALTPAQCLGLLAGEYGLSGNLQLLIVLRLEQTGAVHMLTSDNRKKLLGIIAEYRSAHP